MQQIIVLTPTELQTVIQNAVSSALALVSHPSESNSKSPKVLMTATEAAKHLGINYTKFLEIAGSGEIKQAMNFGLKKPRYRKEDLDSWAQNLTQPMPIENMVFHRHVRNH